MKSNVKIQKEPVLTHGGGIASQDIPVFEQLRRSVLSCMLFEDEHYESGVGISKRIADLIPKCNPAEVEALAMQARSDYNLRHVPLFMVREMARYPTRFVVADTLYEVIQRADELAEFVAMYWKDGKQPLSKQVKKGLRKSFHKFDAYQLAKYARDYDIKLRDVLFLVRPAPENEAQAALWKQLADNTLPPPDTHESAAAKGGLDKATFERLLRDNKLGYMAVLRGLRQMQQKGVDENLIKAAILARKGARRVLPFRYLAAAQHAPRFEQELEQAMLANLAQMPRLPGKTVIVLDLSGSMHSRISAKSDLSRYDAACALGAILREVCEQPAIYATAGNDSYRQHATKLVPNRHGFALIDAIKSTREDIGGGGIFLKQVMDYINTQESAIDRVIVFTDEQDCSNGKEDSPDRALLLGKSNIIINVASSERGIAYKNWLHINGFSEAVVHYLLALENADSLFANGGNSQEFSV